MGEAVKAHVFAVKFAFALGVVVAAEALAVWQVSQ